MGDRRLAVAATLCGALAGWFAAREPSFEPLLWVVLLVACLALPPARRHLLDSRRFAVGLALVGSSWLAAADHELALRHSLLFVAAAVLFGVARLAAPDDRLVGLLAVALALTVAVAFGQAWGGLAAAQGGVGALPSGWQEAAATRLRGGRIFGTATLPGHYAAILMLAVPLLVERARRAGGWVRAALVALLVAVAVAVALTRSLAAIAVACALLVPLLLGRRGRVVWFGAAIVLAAGAIVLAARADMASLEPIRLRWVNWRSAAWVFAHHPWLGVGLGGVGQAALAGPTGAANITPYAHNTPLQLLAELGVVGTVPLVAGAVWLVGLLRRGWASDKGLTLAVASLPLHNLVDFSAYAPEALLPWAVLAGALAGRVLRPPERPMRSWALVAVLGIGGIASALAWRSEAALAAAATPGSSGAVEAAMTAARWAPWTVVPVEVAAGRALEGGRSSELRRVDAALADRAWVQPLSATWAETRGRLLLADRRPGEAVVWFREARRRAPWRVDLGALEAACAPRR